jgi:hypothetical protein
VLGNYTNSTFNFSDDTHGGVLIVDPPATMPAATTIVARGANQTLTGTGATDNFLFNFAAVGHATVTNFHADTDVLQLKAPMFANVQVLLDATQEDGYGGAVRNAVGIRDVVFPGNMKLSFQAARSIG